MKFIMKREEFISILSDYMNILKENPIKPILAGLYFEAKEGEVIFMGNNMEMDYKKKVPCEVIDFGKVVIKPSLILEYVKLLEEESIEIEKLEGYLKIGRAEFSVLEENSYPEIAELASMAVLEMSANEFVTSLEQVKFAAAVSTDNLALNCIRITFGKEKMSFVATDSYRLIYFEKKVSSQLERDISLPLEVAQTIIKLLKDSKKTISLELSGDNLLLLWEKSYFSCRLTAVPFPNYKAILSNNAFDKKMEFCLEDLKAGMKRVITVAKTSLDAKYGGNFSFQGNRLAVKAFSGKAKTQQKIVMMKSGEDFTASLNCKYLAEFLDTISKNAILFGRNSSSMFRVVEDGNEDLIYILMPLALRES